MKFCPSCGEELVDSARFCKRCGMKINENNQNQTKHFTPDQIEFPKKQHTAAVILGYILAVMIPIFGFAIAIYLYTRKDTPKHAKYILLISVIIFLITRVHILEGLL